MTDFNMRVMELEVQNEMTGIQDHAHSLLHTELWFAPWWWDSSVSIVTRQATGWMIWGSLCSRSKRLFTSPEYPDWFLSPPSLLLNGLWMEHSQGMKPVPHLHLAPRLRMSTAMPPHPLHAFMACNGTTFTFSLLLQNKTFVRKF